MELRADPPKASETSQGNGESKTKEGAGGNKIDLSGPLPSIMPALDDIMDKIHSLGEMISEEIIGQVPTLADYFTVVDAVWKELQLGEGSLYQSIVNNMQDNSKNPEIQLDATVRSVARGRVLSTYTSRTSGSSINLLTLIVYGTDKGMISVHRRPHSKLPAGKR